jgi:ribosomal protein S18 acetylase RimI-like enzyme
VGTFTLRLLRVDDADEFVRVRRHALVTDPEAFGERPETDEASQLAFVRKRLTTSSVEQGAVVVGAFAPDLVGFVGVNRTTAISARIWGLYVVPDTRRAGIGRAILERALESARAMDGVASIELSVSESSVAAIDLYGNVGFRTVGEPYVGSKRRMTIALPA